MGAGSLRVWKAKADPGFSARYHTPSSEIYLAINSGEGKEETEAGEAPVLACAAELHTAPRMGNRRRDAFGSAWTVFLRSGW